MRFHIIAIGRIKEPYIRDGIDEYLRRLRGLSRIEITEIREEQYRGSGAGAMNTAISLEGKQILDHVRTGSVILVLDPRGQEISSEKLAESFRKIEISGETEIAFLIGGPAGHSDEVRAAANQTLSLSRLTFPHQMVRLILLEQMYRAMTIIRGIPYHR